MNIYSISQLILLNKGIYYPDKGSGIAADVVTNTFNIPARVQLYGGFVGTESARADRNWETNLTILSGDITQDDNVNDAGVTGETGDIVNSNANRVVEISSGTAETILDGFVVTAGLKGSGSNTGPNRRANHLTNAAQTTNGSGIGIIDSTPRLKNLTIIGNLSRSGGAILIEFTAAPAAAVMLENVAILNNESSLFGGGIYNVQGDIILSDVIIDGNKSAYQGGGVHNQNGSIAFNHVRLTNNVSNNTGGGYYAAGTTTQSFISFNIENNESVDMTQNGGGGVYINGGDTVFKDGIFRGNRSGWHAGGLYAHSGNFQIINTVFSGNQARNSGGGALLNHTSIVAVTNVTVAGNDGDSGGGLKVNSTDAILSNIVSWGNRDDTGSNTLSANLELAPTAMATVAHSNIQGSGGSNAWGVPFAMDGGGNIDGNPQFVAAESSLDAPTAAGSYRIQSTSDLIDNGNNGVDIDGNRLFADE